MGRTSGTTRRGILIHADGDGDGGTVSSYASSAPSVTEGGTTMPRRKRKASAGTGAAGARRRGQPGASAAAEAASDELDFPGAAAVAASDGHGDGDGSAPADGRAAAAGTTGGRGKRRRTGGGGGPKLKRRPSSSSTETESTRTEDAGAPVIPPSQAEAAAAGGGNKRQRKRGVVAPAAEESSASRRTRSSGSGMASPPRSPAASSSRPGGSRSRPSPPSRATTPVASNSSSGRGRRRLPPAAASAAEPVVAPRRRAGSRLAAQAARPPERRQRRQQQPRRRQPQRAEVAPAAQPAPQAAAVPPAGAGTGTATVSEDDENDHEEDEDENEDDDESSVRIVRVLSAPTLVPSASAEVQATATRTPPGRRRIATVLQFLLTVTALVSIQYGSLRLLAGWSRRSSGSSPTSSTSTKKKKKSSHGRHRDGGGSATAGGGCGGTVQKIPFPLERVRSVGEFVAMEAGRGSSQSCGAPISNDTASTVEHDEFMTMTTMHLRADGDGDGTDDDDLRRRQRPRKEKKKKKNGAKIAAATGRGATDAGTMTDNTTERLAGGAAPFAAAGPAPGGGDGHHWYENLLPPTPNADPSSPSSRSRPSWSLSPLSSYLSPSSSSSHGSMRGGAVDEAQTEEAPGDVDDLASSSSQSSSSASASSHAHEMGDDGDPPTPPTLREYLTHPDGFHLAMAPAFFGFYAYFGALIVFDEEVGVLDVRRGGRDDGDGGAGGKEGIDYSEGVSDVGGAIPYCIFCIRDVVRRVTGRVVRGGVGGGGGGAVKDDDDSTQSTKTTTKRRLSGPGGAGAGTTNSEVGSTRLLRSAAGASAGAMAAVLLAAPGKTPRDAADFASTLGLSSFADFPGILAAFRGDRFEEVMRRYLVGGLARDDDDEDDDPATVGDGAPDTVRLEDGMIPVAVTGFDLWAMKGRVLSRGCMARAARASATFPLLFQPVPWSEGFADVGGGGGGGGTGAAANERHGDGEGNGNGNGNGKVGDGIMGAKDADTVDPSSSAAGDTDATTTAATTSLLIDGGITDALGLNGLAALPGLDKRVVNLVVGSFGLSPAGGGHPPGPSRMPPGLRASSVVSVSIVNTPRCGPWAMGNGQRAVEAARRALSDALDVPMERGEEEGHYVLRVDASGFA